MDLVPPQVTLVVQLSAAMVVIHQQWQSPAQQTAISVVVRSKAPALLLVLMVLASAQLRLLASAQRQVQPQHQQPRLMV